MNHRSSRAGSSGSDEPLQRKARGVPGKGNLLGGGGGGFGGDAPVQRKARAATGTGAPGQGAGDWHADPLLLSAMGLGAGAPGEDAATANDPRARGAAGVSGSGGPLPHADVIQRAFGHHDISSITALIGGEAGQAAGELGAEAYAIGERIAFTSAPSLHTAAHEAAHVIQQRGGLRLPGGMGAAGDSHEQSADEVADAVVAGRSAEALLDRYAKPSSQSPAPTADASLQKKPVPDKVDDPRHFHDDKRPKLRLVKEDKTAKSEYRLKDRISIVHWKDDSNYFHDAAFTKPVDLDAFESTREFGAFLETFQEAAVLENDNDEGAEAAAMYLLQEFFSNALFNTGEIERFDYQASPLNYQKEHSYIRAAATGSVDVLKEKLFEGDKLDLDKIYLTNQPAFRDTLHEMFRAIDIDEAPSADTLTPKLDPLAQAMVDHIEPRWTMKVKIEQEAKALDGEAQKLSGQIGNLESKLKGQKREDLDNDGDRELFDWGVDRDSLMATRKDLDKHAGLTDQIKREEDLQKQQAQAPSQDPSQAPSQQTPPQQQPPDPSQQAKGKSKPPPKPKAKAPDASAKPKASKLDGLRIALSKIDDTALKLKVAELAGKLGVDASAIAGMETAALGEHLGAAQIKKAGGGSGDYAKRFGELEQLKALRERKREEAQALRTTNLEVMRDFDKAYGGLVFIDFTALLVKEKQGNVQARLAEWGALANTTLLALVRKHLVTKKLVDPGLAKLMAELESAKGLAKFNFSGGMAAARKDDLSSPALFIDNKTMAVAVKTALGKSGYVPTPTSANRQMVQSGLKLSEIVVGIIDKQLKRQPIDKEIEAKLRAMRDAVVAFKPDQQPKSVADPSLLAGAQAAYEPFCALAKHPDEHVGLMVRPVIQLVDNLKLLAEPSPFPPFALRQLTSHLRDAVADARDIVALQRSVQNLHELVIYGLELAPKSLDPAPPIALDLPDGAQTPHITHYGLNAFSHAFEGVLKQHKADGGGTLEVAALNNIYFEMMQKLGYTQGASGGAIELSQPASAAELVKKLSLPPSSSVSVKSASLDLIVLDIHPNDAAKKSIYQNDVAGLLHQLFGACDKAFRCTVLVDITLNHISEDEVANIRNEADPYIKAGNLNLVFNQSLTKFAQFGTDKHSGGLMFHYNDGASWKAFNDHIEACAKVDTVDPVIGKYFQALFTHTKHENLDYLQKVRLNSRYVYDKLHEQLATISCSEALSLAINDDPKTCYVAFTYDTFAAKLFGAKPEDSQVQSLAHDVLYTCINQLAAQLQLPLNMRTSFGFPLSNLGDIDPGIRLTVGIESPELLDRYVQLLNFANGALGTEFDKNGAAKLKDPAARQQFLREITATIKTLDDLDGQIKAMQKGQGAKQTAVPVPSPSVQSPSGQSSQRSSSGPSQASTSLRGEKIDVGIGAVPHIQNSCYIASLLNLFAASPAYRQIIQQNQPPAPQDGQQAAVPTPIQALCQRLHAAVTALRTPDAVVTPQMVQGVRDALFALGWLEAPDAPVSKKEKEKDKEKDKASATPSKDPTPTPSTSKDPTPTPSKDPAPSSAAKVVVKEEPKPTPESARTAQQDAAEVLQKFLGELVLPGTMTVGEQSRGKRDNEQVFSNQDATRHTGVLQLPINDRNVSTLEQALKKYCETEVIGGYGQKLMTFRALPTTLTIALKRFDFDGYGAAKIHRNITVPQEFVMPAECLHPDLNGRVFRYRVVATVEHQGVYGGGHYIAHGRRDDGSGYKNDDLQDGTRKESRAQLDDSLAKSYLYVFEQVQDAL